MQAQLGPMQYDNAYKDDWRKPILVKREYDLSFYQHSGKCELAMPLSHPGEGGGQIRASQILDNC